MKVCAKKAEECGFLIMKFLPMYMECNLVLHCNILAFPHIEIIKAVLY
jgi:hypothetical protein